MRDSNHTDAMFVDYDTRAADSIGAAFRQSPLMRGYTPNNLNRATAETVVQFTEQQVYAPERDDFDWVINKHVLPELNIRLLQFKSNTPPTTSAEEIGEFVKAVAPHGGITPSQIQRLTADVLNLPYEQIKEDWTRQPLPLTLAGFLPENGGQSLEADDRARLMDLQEKIARITTDELREVTGEDHEVRAKLFELPTGNDKKDRA
jgi:capsid portal protein